MNAHKTMKTKHILWLAVLVAATTTLLLIPSTVAYNSEAQQAPERKLTHAQEVWISALEWCESHGIPAAINPKDKDGTPSYGSFQFKPSTLTYFAAHYHIATTNTMDTDVQHKVLEAMVLDGKNIEWTQQFPDCVKRKVGPPPLN